MINVQSFIAERNEAMRDRYENTNRNLGHITGAIAKKQKFTLEDQKRESDNFILNPKYAAEINPENDNKRVPPYRLYAMTPSGAIRF